MSPLLIISALNNQTALSWAMDIGPASTSRYEASRIENVEDFVVRPCAWDVGSCLQPELSKQTSLL